LPVPARRHAELRPLAEVVRLRRTFEEIAHHGRQRSVACGRTGVRPGGALPRVLTARGDPGDGAAVEHVARTEPQAVPPRAGDDLERDDTVAADLQEV